MPASHQIDLEVRALLIVNDPSRTRPARERSGPGARHDVGRDRHPDPSRPFRHLAAQVRVALMVTQTEFDQLLDLLRGFIRREVMPAEAAIDESDEIPARLIAQAKEMGLYGYALPTEYGGLGLSVGQQVRLTIELGYTSPAFRSLFGTNNGIAGQVLVLAGTDQQRKHWLPRLASGEVVASFALTEPDAGSDPSRLVTSARQVKGEGPGGTGGGSPPCTEKAGGGCWVIDGLKRYITNA